MLHSVCPSVFLSVCASLSLPMSLGLKPFAAKSHQDRIITATTSDISTTPNTLNTPASPVGPHTPTPPPTRIAPSYRVLCQCLMVHASITLMQSTICYINAFSVQLHLSINDLSFSVFSPWCSCSRPTVFVISQPKEVVLSLFVCVLCYNRTDLSFLSVFLFS